MACNVLVLLLLVELGAAGLLSWGGLCAAPASAASTEKPKPPELLPFFASQAWSRAFWQEHRNADAVNR